MEYIGKEILADYKNAIGLINETAMPYFFDRIDKIELEHRLTPDTFKRELSYAQLQIVQNKILDNLKAIENTKWSYSWATFRIVDEFKKLCTNLQDKRASENTASEWLCYFLVQLFANDDKLKNYSEVSDIKIDPSLDIEKQILDSLDVSCQYNVAFCNLGVDKVTLLTGMEYLKPIIEIYLEVNIWWVIYKMIEKGEAKTKPNSRTEKRFPKKYTKEQAAKLFELLENRQYITHSTKNSSSIFLYYCGYGDKPDFELLNWNAQNNELAYLIDNLFGSNCWSVAEKIFGVSNLARAKNYYTNFGIQQWKDGIDSLLEELQK